MQKKVLQSILYLAISLFSYSQSLTWGEVNDLQSRISSFISRKDSVYFEDRSSQLVYIIFETDSTGSIIKIHLMGNENDTLYRALKNITINDFIGWKSIRCKMKTIIAPYFYISDNPKKSIADKILSDYYKTLKTGIIFRESNNTVFIKYLFSIAPLRPKSGLKTGKYNKGNS